MRGGFVDFFEKAFQWLAEVSQKLPAVDTNLFFIVVMAVIFGLGIVIAFTLLGSRARKLFVSARKIRKYLANVDVVDDDNVSDFTAHCFSKNTPQPLRDAWVQYLGVRFGYPSDIISDGAVYDKFVKKNKDVRSGVFIGVSLVLLALFAFWGYGVLPAAKMGVVHLAALALIGVMDLVLVILARKQNQRCFETFEAMQEDLDAKVNLQIESNFATDSSPLQELNSLVEEIIARNTAKVVDEDDDEQTPIEALIEQKMQEQSEFGDEDEQENIDEIISAQEEAQEENAQDGDVESDDEQRHIDELLQEQEERLEETADEESDETETAIEEVDEQVEKQEHIDELLQEQKEELEEKAQEESEETELEIESADETFVDEPQESEEEQSVEEQEEVETVDESESVDEPETVDEASDESENEEVADVENEEIEENTENVEYTESEENNVQEEESEEQEVTEDTEDEHASDEEATEETENAEEVATDESAEESEQEESEPTEVEESEESADESVEDGEEADDNAESEIESEEAESDESENEESEEEADEDEDESEEIEEAREDEEPEVVYVVDDEDEEENAKPAKLVKLPNLVDYMLSKNMPRQMKIQIATMLIGTYNKFKDSKEDRKIVISCLGKVMRDLQNEKQ